MTDTVAAPAITKGDLVHAMAERTGMKVKEALAAFDALADIIGENLAAGNTVRFHDVGTLKTVYRPARMCRNPRTGESVEVPERYAVSFKAFKTLVDKVNA
jgi:DNA-binding protein HU-beta